MFTVNELMSYYRRKHEDKKEEFIDYYLLPILSEE